MTKLRSLPLRRWPREIIRRSVFEPVGKGASMEAILASLFHRASATIYFLYVVWAAISIPAGIPSLIAARGTDWQVLFSIAILIATVPACFGAIFWPSFARLEAFMGTAFVGLIILYIGWLVANQVTGVGQGTWAGVFLISSILVMPTCRCVVVIIFLIRQAEERERKYQEYIKFVRSQEA